MSPGRKPNPPDPAAATVGLVIMTFSTSLVKSKSNATLAANRDLPEPALPFNTDMVLCSMVLLASFCSSLSWI
jgi:hypothetical protein